MAPAPAPAGGGRKRRQTEPHKIQSIDDTGIRNYNFQSAKSMFSPNSSETEKKDQGIDIVSKLLPVLTIVGHAQDRLIPINCTFRSICQANKMLVDKFGNVGRSVAAVISAEMGKMLISPEPRRGPVTLRQVQKVGQIGRNGLQCNILFKDCDELSFLPNYMLPPNIPWDNPIFRQSNMGRVFWSLQRSPLLKNLGK